jgi:hypothetical protein
MFEYKLIPMEIYGETEEELQQYLKPNQRFVAFREPRIGEMVLLQNTELSVRYRTELSFWYRTDEYIRLIIETIQPEMWKLTQVIPTPKTIQAGDYWSCEDGNIIRAIYCFNVKPSEKVFKLTKKGGTTV